MAKILVTGGTGFIGIPLVKKLHELGHEVKLLIRESSNTTPFKELNKIDYVVGDVQDLSSLEKAVNKVDAIYHLAAYTGIWAKDKSIYYDVNVKGTENIANVALKNNLKLFYVSSFTALGPTPFYPGIVYGPRDFNVFGRMLFDVMRGKLLPLGACPGKGEAITCLSYVYDTSNALADILNREDLFGEDFILGGENVRFKDYLDLISKIERNKKARRFPYTIAWVYALLLEVKARFNKKTPFLTRPTLRAIKYNRSYSSKKAIDKFGYRITPLKDGLEETIKWYKEYSEERKK